MDNQSALPDELERASLKIDQDNDRKVASTGHGATTGGRALTKRYHERLTEGFRMALLDAHKGARNTAELVVLLRGLDQEVIALSCIQTVLHSIGKGENLRETLLNLGSSISNECWAAGLTVANDGFAKRVARVARMGHSTTTRRLSSAKKQVDAARNYTPQAKHSPATQKARMELAKSLVGFKERIWNKQSYLAAGTWLYNVLMASLPEVFVREQEHGTTEWYVDITPEGMAVVDEALVSAADNNPVFWPSPEAPKPWDAWTGGGAHDERVNKFVSVLRTPNRDTQAAVRHAIKAGTMQPALDALNTLQAVPFKINTQVLAVLKECESLGLTVKGLVPPDLEIPEKLNAFQKAEMEDAQQRFYNLKRDEKRRTNSGYRGDRVMFGTDIKIADEMAKHERFYTAMNLDWRGRVYALPSFNFQREDRVRALFLFADGLPIGVEGLRYLKIHTANVADFRVSGGSKISRRPLEERVQWCDDNIQLITNIASAPLVHTEWMKAGKPFLFLAACFELAAELEQGPSFITHLPTCYDGSCSGLQHLCAMTRAEEGWMVNLTSSELPQDVYQMVADDAYAQVERDLTHAPDPDAKDPEVAAKASKDIRAMARLFLDFDGDRRDIAKRNVMTYSYSSKKFGMAAQQQEDLMDPLAREVLEGTLAEHPFAGYCHGPCNKDGEKQPSKAARYIAGRIFEAIETRIHKPAEAMKFLQSIAKAMAHEGKPVQWTTPVGIPWINRYNPTVVSRVELYLVEGGITSRTRVNIATGFTKEIDKTRSANSVAPNFVHALDASALLLAVTASKLEGITSMATVHDSFGCLAPQAARFNQIIREQFALMYEKHDVLAQILEQASRDLTPANRTRLPEAIIPGPLNLKDILNADFAFA